jgi:hypothetical protein
MKKAKQVQDRFGWLCGERIRGVTNQEHEMNTAMHMDSLRNFFLFPNSLEQTTCSFVFHRIKRKNE